MTKLLYVKILGKRVVVLDRISIVAENIDDRSADTVQLKEKKI